MSDVRDTIVEVRDILSGLHDGRITESRRKYPLSTMEMAAIRDSVRRLNDALIQLSRSMPEEEAGDE